MMPNWMLPEHISDVLPSEARKIEEMRRIILDLFRTFGYEFVIPPLLEYADTYQAKPNTDLLQNSFRWLDHTTQKLLAIRTDMTPQVARIDAHLLNRQTMTRLCYADSTLQTHTHAYETRQPIQIGAEFYGSPHIAADLEIIELMLQSLEHIGVLSQHKITLSIAHASIYRVLDINYDSNVYKSIRDKCWDEVCTNDHAQKQFLFELLKTHDVKDVLNILHQQSQIEKDDFKKQSLYKIIEEIDLLANNIQKHIQKNHLHLCVDLLDIESYTYHTGLSFGVYLENYAYALARGGRYDHFAQQFSKDRPATGFSMNLRQLAPLANVSPANHAILAPWGVENTKLLKLIHDLRAQGLVVVCLPDEKAAKDLDEFTFTKKIVEKNNEWMLDSM